MNVGRELDEALEAGSWSRLERVLARIAAEPDSEQEARAWYRGHRAAPATRATGSWSRDPHVDHRLCLALLAVALAPTPQQAARWCGFGDVFLGHNPGGRHALISALIRRGRDWCADFFEETGAQPVRRVGAMRISLLAEVALPVMAALDLEPPAGPTFATSWADHYADLAAQRTHDRRSRRRSRDGAPESLADALRGDPYAAANLGSVLSTPGAVGLLENSSDQDWRLDTAVASLVADGTLERDPLVEACLGALTRHETPASQKAISRMLTGLAVDARDLEDRVPLVHGLMATCRGPITATLLPPFLDAVTSADDLVELAGTIMARREKAQKSTLVRALVRDDAVERWGLDGVVAALRLAADVPDEATATRARAALERLGAELPVAAVEVLRHDLWTSAPPPPSARRTELLGDDDAALTAAVSRSMTGASSIVTDALLLDALVRRAARDLPGLDRWLTRTGESSRWEVPVPVWVLAGHARATLETHLKACELTVQYQDGQQHPGTEYWAVTSQPVTQALATLHHGEAALRLGSIPFLVSTPTRDDGSLELDALVDRLRRYGDRGVGSLDLFLALLRLTPVATSRAEQLAGVHAPLWLAGRPRGGFARLLGRREPARLDAGDIVRTWVAGGGLPALRSRRTDGGIGIDRVSLPVPIETFLGAPPGLVAGHTPGVRDFIHWSVVGATTMAVVPWWPDLVAAKAAACFDQYSRGLAPRLLPSLAAAPGPAGLAVHHVVAATLSHADEDHRLVGAEAALTLMGREQWDPALFADACLNLLGRGELRLSRTSSGWEQVVLGGGMQGLWPAVLAVVEAACALPRKPAGLADLVAFYGRYAAAEPAPRPPRALVALAAARGGGKSQLEARAAVSSLLVGAVR